MAERQAAATESAAHPSRNIATAANWIAAAVSVALIAGVAVWGYRLVMRDVSGIPVVRAADGPMRVAPEDPGGRLADHQGLAVNDVAGTGTAAPPADRLVLAPRATGLADEDQPRPRLAVTPAAPAMPATRETVSLAALDAGAVRPDEAVADAGPEAPGGSGTDEIDPIEALANEIAANVAPLTVLAPDGFPDAEGPARSLRPRTRPGTLRVTSLAPAVPAAAGTRDIDGDSLPAGTRLVQLGAFDSVETARGEWRRLDARFGDFLKGKDRVIERASSGGRVFYRLRAHGFADLSDARRFCAALVAENADCIPVVAR